MPSVSFANTIGGGSGGGTYTSSESIQWNNQWIPQTAPPPPPYVAPQIKPVTPTFDPQIDANALYGKPMVLSALGKARIGAAPAPIVGPYITGSTVDFIVSFGVPADPAGTRVIYAIYFDNELAWSSVAGGTLPADGVFASEPFDFVFKPGTLTQTVCSLETDKFPGDECAYRPQMLLEIRNLPYARFMAITGKPVPYVACDIGDTTGGADPDDGITIGQGYERIAYSPWVGWTSAKLEEVGTSDVTGGYLLRDNFNIIQLGQSLTNIYRNLVLSTSDKVRLTDRGANVTPDIVFDRDTIIGGESGVIISRTAPSAEPREDELLTIDPDQDYTIVPSQSKRPRNPVVVSASVGKQTYTLPVILDASTRQALITYAQYHSENARKKVAFRTTIFGLEIEPGDLFALTLETAGLDNEVFKATEVTVNGDWTVDIQGEAVLRCRIYGTESFPGIVYTYPLEDADSGGWAGLTFAHVIDAGNFAPSSSSLYARITLKFAAFSLGAVMSACYFGTQAAIGDRIDFSGDQVQVLFGGLGSITSDGTLVYVSDWFELGTTYNPEQNYVFAAQFDAGGTISFGRTLSAALGNRTEFKAGADAATTDKTGYTFDNQNTAQFVSLIEIADTV